jgi:hypothetical protein
VATTLLVAADDADHDTPAGSHVEVGAWQAMRRHIAISGQDLTELIRRLNPDLLADAGAETFAD